jgi:hypothetical protein
MRDETEGRREGEAEAERCPRLARGRFTLVV